MISHVFGTVGSGKTFDMLCRIVDDLVSGHQIVTINCSLYEDLAKNYLIDHRDMHRWDADRALADYRRITTLDEFRSLQGKESRMVKLYVDEAAYWWPPEKNYALDIEDMLAISMSRKRFVDIHMTSQRKDQINKMIVGYASSVWASYRMTLAPIPQIQELQRKIVSGTRLKPWLPWFYYVRGVGDTGSDTFVLAKAAMSNKRRRVLDLDIAALYDTTEQASSPVLDKMKRQGKINRMRDILAGVYKPSSTCPKCSGAKLLHCALIYDHDLHDTVVVQADEHIYQHPWFVKMVGKQPCDHCREWLETDTDRATGDPLGYIYPPDHPEILEAQHYRHMFDASYKIKGVR